MCNENKNTDRKEETHAEVTDNQRRNAPFFPKNTTPKQMEETIIRLLERELQRKRSKDSR